MTQTSYRWPETWKTGKSTFPPSIATNGNREVVHQFAYPDENELKGNVHGAIDIFSKPIPEGYDICRCAEESYGNSIAEFENMDSVTVSTLCQMNFHGKNAFGYYVLDDGSLPVKIVIFEDGDGMMGTLYACAENEDRIEEMICGL